MRLIESWKKSREERKRSRSVRFVRRASKRSESVRNLEPEESEPTPLASEIQYFKRLGQGGLSKRLAEKKTIERNVEELWKRKGSKP